MVHKLDNRYIEKYTGLTPQQISEMPIEDVHAAIGRKIGHKIKNAPGTSRSRSMLQALGEVVTSEEIDIELAKV
jgi:hypothetical protein